MSIQQKLNKRHQQNSFRFLKTQADNLVDFSSNDYLGFSRSDVIYEKAHQYVLNAKSKNGSTGSRLLTGNHDLYTRLEKVLTEFHESEAALVFNSGYDANIGLLSAILQRNDIIICDEYAHASIRDGIQMARAKALKFKHNDLEDLRKKLNNCDRQNDGTVYIITESIFSMDGDHPDFLGLIDIAEAYNAQLIVDEAHATGVIGEDGAGLIQKLGLSHKIFARIHTFGKALGAHGAAILGSKQLIDYLINFSRPFIYTTALPPHTIATVLAAYEEMNASLVISTLRQNIQLFKTQISENQLDDRFIQSDSAIQACLIKGNQKVKKVAAEFNDHGFEVKPILSPTVPADKERLRFCLHSFNTENNIILALRLLRELIIKT